MMAERKNNLLCLFFYEIGTIDFNYPFACFAYKFSHCVTFDEGKKWNECCLNEPSRKYARVCDNSQKSKTL